MINKIISFSIKNKALIGLMTIGLILGGIYSMTKVPLDAMPDITNNQVLVITTAPNLGTEDIEQFVTYQVELAVANLPDVTEIRSVSRFGLSVVTIVFKESAGTYLPRQLVSEALAEVKEKIPDGFGEPFMAPISTGLGEIYQYTLEVQAGFDTIYDDMELRTMQEWIVKRQMAMLPGVVEVNSFGGRGKQYEVAVNPDKLRSMGLTITDIFDALEANNQNTGGAYIEKNYQANFIRGEGLMRSLDDIKNTVVSNKDNQAIFIRDVAEVKYGSFLRFGAFTKDGKGEAVGGIVMMLKGENSNDVIADVKERIALIQKSLPEGVVIKPFLDRSKLIKSTTSTVAENLSLGALIVIFVLVIFLGNLRGGLIVASTIPLALLFAFIMMNLFGVWANLMSLGALDFGILVDGAVIIVESMIFYLHKKNLIGTKLDQPKRNEIAYKSASKMMNSAFFGQLIILIVFIPVLALQGVEGKMFIPMAMTFGFAVLGVVVLCLTYIPMMAALFIQPPKTDKKTWGDRLIAKLENIYSPVIDWAIKRSRIVIAIALILLISGGFLFTRMGAEFIPKLDEGDFAFQAFLKPGTSLTEVTKASTRLEQIVMENFPDEIESIQSRIGVADLPMDPMPIDIADIFVILTPQDQWTRAESKKELIDKVREKVSVLPGINFEFSQPVEMRFNELLTGIRQDLAVKLYGDDLDILADKAEEIAGLIAGIDGVAAVKAEATRGLPQITVNYDRNKMGRYGLNITELNTVIETAFSGGVAGSIYEGEKMFDLVVRLDEEHRKSIDDIRNLYVILQDGNQIPLKEVAEISYQPGPMQISRDNTNRRTYVGINVEGRDIKSLVEEIQTTLDKRLELPTGYYIRYGGAFENLERASKRLTLVVPLALGLIFMLVFFAVKSFKQTLMIYVAVPFAAVGGIFSLYLRDMPFSISAGVGFIVLFGVAVLNGLVLISGFNELKEEGKLHINDIIKKGSLRRIRPILLTASTDILGFLPMAVSASAGAEVQRPLATVVIGGMLTSTLLTLIVLPILYKYVESSKKTIKLPKVGMAVLTVLMIVTISVLPNELSAQNSSINLQQAIERAKENYPSIKAAQMEVDKQKALKATAYDFGSTSIYTGKEEVGNGMPGVQNQIGIEQSDIDIFAISAKSKLADTRTHQAVVGLNLTEQTLSRDVSIAWYKAVYNKQQWLLFVQLDSLYSNFQKAAELRYKTQQTSKIEFLSASAKYKELQVNIKKAKSNYLESLQILNQYLLYPSEFDVNIQNIGQHVFDIVSKNDSLNESPLL
jgi:cobalt-zinc-cadmium resistance protein CzcA